MSWAAITAWYAANAGTIATVASIGGAVAGAAGAIQSGKAQEKAAKYNAQVSRMEASAEESRRRRESRRQLGAISAGIAKSGITTEGTPLMVLAESAEMAELDALSARWTGATSARLDEQRAKSARKAIPYAVGSSLLTGVSRISARKVQ